MKLSDDSYDRKNEKALAIIFGIFSGLTIGYLVVNSIDAAYIFLGIFIGTLLSKKIDGIHHIITALVFFLYAILFGIPAIGIGTLIICSFASYIDEFGNDNSSISKKSKFFGLFFKYRFSLKIVVMVLSILGLIQFFYPNFLIPGLEFMQFYTIIYFIFFELFYEIAGLKFEAIYNGLNRLSRALGLVN
ncbi:MAG: hypothetical protein QME14_05330 [Methanobacteriaceae archaeon]|nr:hypothetical protein [Methanobacteriaceae archaeon]